jgi:5-methylcytosine-specific restriction endonuclease McrA
MRAWRATEKGKAYTKRYSQSEKHEAVKARYRASEKGRAKEAEYNKSEAKRKAQSRWAAKPEAKTIVRANYRKRRARLLGAEGSHTSADIQTLFEKQKARCFCTADLSVGYHVDHIIPLARGGSDGPDNLQLLCPPCNISKGARTMLEWLS